MARTLTTPRRGTTTNPRPESGDNYSPVVDEVVLSGNVVDEFNSVSFRISGEPVVQNGWSFWSRNRSMPVVYDVKQRHKKKLRKAIEEALQIAMGGGVTLPFFDNNDHLGIVVAYGVKRYGQKNLDNLSKFLFDAMEGVVFRDNAAIGNTRLTKAETETETQFTEVCVFKVN